MHSQERKKRQNWWQFPSPFRDGLIPFKEEVLTNSKLQYLVKLVQEGEAVGPWEFKDGVLFFKSRIYLNSDSSLLPIIIQEFHSNTHEGIHKTLQRIRSVFYWVGMKKQIRDYIRHCDVCQRHKTECTSPAGLLQPLPIPTKVWSDISMDFVDGLPTSMGKSTIFVVVDRLPKYAHFIPISHPYTAQSVAKEFFDHVFLLHGLPESIVCETDPAFTSKFWEELFRLNGTSFNFSSAYHPQTDGQTEVVNRTLEMYLRCFSSPRPKEWTKWIA